MGWTHWAISRSSQCSTTGVTKAVVCVILYGMGHIKEPLLLIGKSRPYGSSGFPLSLSEWSFTICLMPYNCKQNVLSVSLNKTLSSFIRRKQAATTLWVNLSNYQQVILCIRPNKQCNAYHSLCLNDKATINCISDQTWSFVKAIKVILWLTNH